jgi:hypothetical protein
MNEEVLKMGFSVSSPRFLYQSSLLATYSKCRARGIHTIGELYVTGGSSLGLKEDHQVLRSSGALCH